MSAAAFADPVFQSQVTFRAVLRATSRPGEIVAAGAGLAPPAPLAPAAAAALLTLADFETPLWLSPVFERSDVCGWLKLHSGAPRAAMAASAAFALAEGDALDLSLFAQGTPAYPDRSTTIVVQVDALVDDGELTLSGPGVRGERQFDFSPRPSGFLDQWRVNGAAFPLGVDLILAAGERLAALPRTTRIVGGG